MASVNKILVIGNLGRDPEIRFTPNGDCVANMSIGTTDKWKDKSSGELKEATEWHRVSVFGKSAEYIQKYAKKGSQIYVEGSLRTRKWQDKDGQDRYTTEIRADDVQLLGGRPQGGNGDQQSNDYGDQQQRQGNNQQSQQRPANDPQNNGQQRQGNSQQNQQRPSNGQQGNNSGYSASGSAPSFDDDIPFAPALNRKNHHFI